MTPVVICLQCVDLGLIAQTQPRLRSKVIACLLDHQHEDKCFGCIQRTWNTLKVSLYPERRQGQPTQHGTHPVSECSNFTEDIYLTHLAKHLADEATLH